jgi:Lipase (class 3)
MVDATSQQSRIETQSRLPDGLGSQPAFNPVNPSISARATGSDARIAGTATGPTAQERLNWAQPQSKVQMDAKAGTPNPAAIMQTAQVAQERLGPVAVAANAPTPPNSATLAQLANAAYSPTSVLPAGFRPADAADLSILGLRQADLAPSNSAFRAEVYVTGTGADTQYVVAFRGSTSDRRDWISNGQQAAGLNSDHYSRALAVGRALARNEAVPVTITGHSLGGGLASAAAIASGRDATTFNAAGLSQNTINQANTIRNAEGAAGVANVSAFYVRGEILSVLQDGGDRVLGSVLGRFAGSAIGGPLGGVAGAQFGRTFADAPEAYGNRIALDAVRPNNLSWYQDFPVLTSFNRHGMDYVLSSMGVR